MNRREFIKGSSVLTAMAAAAPSIVVGQGAPREFKVGIVGCGGRGSGAFGNLVEAAKQLNCTIKLVAAADMFEHQAKNFAKSRGGDEKLASWGASAYKNVMSSDAEIVILTTPLNFRPVHLAAAVEAGKHVFAEKGVAVDGAGCRLFIEASRKAAEKKLTIVAGTQRRHQRGYRLQAKALFEDKTVSPVLGGNVYWNGSVPWVKRRSAGESNAQYLCKNWLNFTELSGDHICEQHVHNIDVANWFIGRYPRTAVGFGARTRRYSGNQYDFFGIDFDYGDGVHIHSMCRQIDGCHNNVSEHFRTAEAEIFGGGQIRKIDGSKLELKGDFPDGNPYVIEHADLLRSIMGTGPYYNEGETVAMSTACGVIGRIACYTGQIVRLSDILEKQDSPFYNMNCVPSPQDFEMGGDVTLPGEILKMPDLPGIALPGKPWRDLAKYND
ncbi:MAG: Gfo/Idh/MocA family oxidoreductase [Kiritimatiellae bacterium]|nr:Gfo/Idh/MocA family oxidoreductase [Kiritimatiellia bacterium]